MSEYICPNCHKPIYDDDALLCHFCGESLKRSGNGFLGGIKYQNNRVWWYFLIFVALAAFVLIFVF